MAHQLDMDELLRKYDGGRVPDIEELLGGRLIETYLRGFAQMHLWPVAMRIPALSYEATEDKWQYSKEISPRWMSWQKFCQTLRNIEVPAGTRPFDRKCQECDVAHARLAEEAGDTIGYMCAFGRVDFAVPIVLEGKTIAVLWAGQYRPAPGDDWPEAFVFPERRDFRGRVDAWSESLRRLDEAKRLLPGFEAVVDEVANESAEITPEKFTMVRQELQVARSDLEALGQKTLDLERRGLLALFRGKVNDAFGSGNREAFWDKMCHVINDFAALIGAEEGFLATYGGATSGHLEVHCGYRQCGKSDAPTRPFDPARIHAAFNGRSHCRLTGQAAHDALGGLVPANRVCLVFAVLNEGLLVFLCGEDREESQVPKRPGDIDYIAEFAADLGSAIQVQLVKDQLERRATELEEARDERDKHLENIAHELRSPIQTVRLASARLERATTDQERAEAIRRVQHQIARIDRMIERFWDTQHMLAGKLPLTNQKLNVFEVLKEVADAVVDWADRSDIEIQIDDEIKRWPPVQVDRDVFRHVVRNLLDNAVKYSTAASYIKAGAGRGRKGELRLEFVNRGLLIPKEERTKIFERYYRCRKAIQRYPSSSGLGLAFVAEFGRRYNVPIELDCMEIGPEEAINVFRLILSPAWKVYGDGENPPC